MKAEKLTAILREYPWLSEQLSASLATCPDPKNFKSVAIKTAVKEWRLGELGRSRFQRKRLAGTGWENINWILLFRVREEKLLRSRPLNRAIIIAERDLTLAEAARDVEKSYTGPIKWVALMKIVASGDDSTNFPLQVELFLIQS